MFNLNLEISPQKNYLVQFSEIVPSILNKMKEHLFCLYPLHGLRFGVEIETKIITVMDSVLIFKSQTLSEN